MDAKEVKVEIITIGDEILIGQIVDTNSTWIAVELNKIGLSVVQITSVHDDCGHITKALDLALDCADVVLLTGGLGPTNDDVTKKTLAKYFNSPLIFSQSVFDNILSLFGGHSNFHMNELTHEQALVPECCEVVGNAVGTAPAMWFERNGRIVVSMPGVPNEMMSVLTEIVRKLQKNFHTPFILHKTVLVSGYEESELAIKIAAWERSLTDNMSLAYLPDYGVIKLRLSGCSDDSLMLEFAINQQFEGLRGILGSSIIAFDDVSVSKVIGDLLKACGLTMCTAESCTGGYIAHLITSIPGCSDYFKGSVVAYSNEVKQDLLRVEEAVLMREGAVSAAVVEQMAKGVRKTLNADVSVATSGVAGPSGGTAMKPVGTVWIAASSRERTISREFYFGNSREQNIFKASQAALLLLREVIIS